MAVPTVELSQLKNGFMNKNLLYYLSMATSLRVSLIPQLDQNRRLIQFAQTVLGKIALLTIFVGLYSLFFPHQWISALGALSLLTAFPHRRPMALLGANV